MTDRDLPSLLGGILTRLGLVERRLLRVRGDSVAPAKILYTQGSSGIYMNGSQTATLSELVSEQPNGIVLAWSRYATTAQNDTWNFFFVPKAHVLLHPGTGVKMSGSNTDASSGDWRKYVYVHDDRVVGTPANAAAPQTLSVLRYIAGV